VTPAYREAVVGLDSWPKAAVLDGQRVRLEPLLEEHAEELEPVLADPRLHTYIGGEPADRDQLRGRFRRQAVGRSPDGSQLWLNWLIRSHASGRALGWVVGTAYQGEGYAKEAAGLMVAWLREQTVDTVVAHVNPQHTASMAVARSIGLTPTDSVADGEVRWQA
jgi:hypothetical protein